MMWRSQLVGLGLALIVSLSLLVEASETNGLKLVSRLMVDKITTVPKTKLGARIGELADGDMVRLNRAMIVFLGLAGKQRSRKRRGSRSAR
jgi:hypothetical protein